MEEKSVSFKVVLNDAKNVTEVRRFVVDRDVSTSLAYILDKLVQIFPLLRRKDFKLSWTDEDGDKVIHKKLFPNYQNVVIFYKVLPFRKKYVSYL